MARLSVYTSKKKKKNNLLLCLHGRLEKKTGFELAQLFSQAAEDLTLNNSPAQLQLQLVSNASSATLRVGTYSPIYLILYFFTWITNDQLMSFFFSLILHLCLNSSSERNTWWIRSTDCQHYRHPIVFSLVW